MIHVLYELNCSTLNPCPMYYQVRYFLFYHNEFLLGMINGSSFAMKFNNKFNKLHFEPHLLLFIASKRIKNDVCFLKIMVNKLYIRKIIGKLYQNPEVFLLCNVKS